MQPIKQFMTITAAVFLISSAPFQANAVDIIHGDDVIIEGSLCTSDGNNCADAENFLNFGPSGAQLELKVKDNHPAIGFETTSATAADWVLSVLNEDFIFENDESNTTPFTIENGSGTDLLYLDADNRIGLNTDNPLYGLHVATPDTSLFLDRAGTASDWRMWTGGTALFYANGGSDPVKFFNGAPTNSLVVEGTTGDIGLGTSNPTSALTVQDPTNSRIAVINSDTSSVVSRVMVNLVNNGAPVVQMNDSSTGSQWNFRTGSGGRFVIDSPSGNNPQMQVFGSGNVTIKGTLTQGSSRTYKDNIESVDVMDILSKVAALEVSKWSYKENQGDSTVNGIRHVGPMAEDFHAQFGLGHTDKGISSLDSAGVALAAIKGLNQLVGEKSTQIQHQKQAIDDLKLENKNLQTRLVRLERLVLAEDLGDSLASN